MCSTVAEDELDGLTDGELLEHVAGLVAEQNRLAARLARAVRRAENRQSCEHDGLKTMRSWLTAHTRLAGPAVTSIVRQGRALEALPAVEAAYLAGRITGDHVETIAEITRPEHVDRAVAQDIDLPVVADALVTIAATQPHRQLQAAVGRYVSQLDPDGAEPDPTGERSLTLAQHPDSSWTLSGTLDAVGGDKVATTLETLAAASRTAGDTRSRAQRYGDALVQLCDLALASGQLPILRSVKPQLIVTVSLADLADPHTGAGAATAGTGALLSAARARWATCDGTITRVVLDPDGQPLDVGRSQRLVPPHLRRALEVRDRGCVFAGCSAPSWWCDAHHLLEWINGGETSLQNSALLCERHHTKVHHGFRIERQPDGRWRTWRPDGTEILVGYEPAPRSSAVRILSGQGVGRPSAMAT